jgi:hypothetical protein
VAALLRRAILAAISLALLAGPAPAAPHKKPTPKPSVRHLLFMSGVVHKPHRAKPLVVALTATPKPKAKAKPKTKPKPRTRVRRRTRHYRGS